MLDAPGISSYMDLHSDLAVGPVAELRGDQRGLAGVGDVPVLERRVTPAVTSPEPTGRTIYPPYDGVCGLFSQSSRVGPRLITPTTTTTTVTCTSSGSRPAASILMTQHTSVPIDRAQAVGNVLSYRRVRIKLE